MELKDLQGAPLGPRMDDPFPFPRMIATGNGGSIIVSAEIDRTIARVAQVLKANSPKLALSHTDEEWRMKVRSAFGPVLARIDLDGEASHSAALILDGVNEALNVDQLRDVEYSVGCTLFSNRDVPQFAIGPVTFEPRLQWLERRVQENHISPVSSRRIVRTWDGRQPRPRKSSIDSAREQDVLRVVGGCPYVCSISTTALAPEFGREKAMVAARLALAAISLAWEDPSDALRGLNLAYDGLSHRQRVLTFGEELYLAGFRHSRLPHGPYIPLDEWSKLLSAFSNSFSCVGEVLEHVLSATGNGPRPRIVESLALALWWFHEGCRSESPMFSVVQFAACLDALSGGKKEAGILKLVRARLGIAESKVINKDGTTVKQLVSRIYGEGRSRTVHGTNKKLAHDWSTAAFNAQQLARACLIACLEQTGSDKSIKEPVMLQG
ncbi:MAG: hypothetical protein WD081_01950 [Gammaproteobacteria bacterium]